MKKPTGELIYDIIIRENVSQSALCRGLCSTSAFSRYLNGERTLDRLLFTVILQRLGKSPDKFITMLTDEEYSYFEWKQRICQAQLSRDWKSVYALLQEEQAQNRNCNALLQEQYYMLMQGVIREKLFNDRAESVQLIGEAIALTVPGFPEQAEETLLRGQQLLGEQEILAILLWQSLQQEKEKSFEVLRLLMHYIEIHYQDEQETVKLYPKVAAQYLQILYQEGKYHECMSIAEKAVGMMISTGYSFCMETILTVQVNAAEKLGLTEQMEKRKVQLAAWKEVMQEYRGQDDREEDLFLLDIWQEAELLHETLSLRRQESGYSQETLSEGICTPETLSRIETGKRPPRRKTYHALNEKLSLRRDYFYSVIETDDFRVLEEKWQLDKLLMLRKWEEAETALKKSEMKLDMTQGCNRQYIANAQSIINQQMGKVCMKDELLKLVNILGYTVENPPRNSDVAKWPDSFWIHPFTNGEINVLINMSDVLDFGGQTECAARLLEKILEFYQNSRIKPEFHFRPLMLVIQRLSAYYGILHNHQKGLLFSEEGVRLSLECGGIEMLPQFLNNKADALENLRKKEPALKCYRLAFYLSELLHTSTAEIAKRSYEKLCGHEREWY